MSPDLDPPRVLGGGTHLGLEAWIFLDPDHESRRTLTLGQSPTFHTGHSSTWSRRHFKDSLKTLWFDLYSRMHGVQDTSAFEHVFVGEVLERTKEIGGMHSWLRFYAAERDGSVDYAGYVVKRKVRPLGPPGLPEGGQSHT